MSFLTQKLIWRKTKLLPDEKSRGLGTYTRIRQTNKKKMAYYFFFFPTILG